MLFPNIDPFVFGLTFEFDLFGRHWGPLGLRWYALAYVAGILLGWRYIVGLVKNEKLWGGRPAPATPVQVDDLVLWATLGIIVGGRLGSVLFYGTADSFAGAFMVWKGGMSFHGGLLGVLVVLVLFSRFNKIQLLALADLVACAQPIGQFFGRIANFVNGELYGRVTDSPMGMVFCNKTIEEQVGYCPAGDLPRHPSQLYEAALEGIGLFIVLRVLSHRYKWLQRPGAVTGAFLVGYAVIRIVLETVREPDQGLENLPLGLTMGMILSIPMAAAGAWLIWQAHSKPTELALAGAAPPTDEAPVRETAKKPAPKRPAAPTSAKKAARSRTAKPKA